QESRFVPQPPQRSHGGAEQVPQPPGNGGADDAMENFCSGHQILVRGSGTSVVHDWVGGAWFRLAASTYSDHGRQGSRSSNLTSGQVMKNASTEAARPAMPGSAPALATA